MTFDGAARRARALFNRAVGAGADALARLGARPNDLTWLSLAPATASLAAAASGRFGLAILFMTLAGLCDLLDGPLARRQGRTSAFGALLDSTLDRYADAAPLMGLVVFYAPYPLAALTAALAAFAGYSVSYARARAEGLGIGLPWLWMRRTERLAIVAAGLLLAPVTIPGVNLPAPLTLLAVAAVAALSLAATAHLLFVAAKLTEGER